MDRRLYFIIGNLYAMDRLEILTSDGINQDGTLTIEEKDVHKNSYITRLAL